MVELAFKIVTTFFSKSKLLLIVETMYFKVITQSRRYESCMFLSALVSIERAEYWPEGVDRRNEYMLLYAIQNTKK